MGESQEANGKGRGEPAGEPAAEPADKPAAEPADKPTPKAAEKSAAKPAGKPAAKPWDRPVAKPADRPGAKPGDKPATKPTEKPWDKLRAKPANKPTPTPGDKPAPKPADKPAAVPLPPPRGAAAAKPLAPAVRRPIGGSAAGPPSVPRPGRSERPGPADVPTKRTTDAAPRATPVPPEPMPLAEGEYPLPLAEGEYPLPLESKPPPQGDKPEPPEPPGPPEPLEPEQRPDSEPPAPSDLAAEPEGEEPAQPDSQPRPPRDHGSGGKWTIGRMVGRCELFTEIAHGGMATIHLGRWLGAGGFTKPVAVKALHPQYARDPDFVRMFMDEARVVAGIHHPNVMPTLDLVEEQSELFIVMDYVEGVTLAHLMRQAWEIHERIPAAIVLRVLAGVLHGLHAAHEAKNSRGEPMCVVHRDVSPENIMVGVDGYPRLIDFGIATALDRFTKTRDGELKGKLAYLAPEQLLGTGLTRRTDVFAASIVLWQALTGRKLFSAQNVVEAAHKVLSMPIEPPSAVSSRVPKNLDGIVMRGLERDPEKRWPTAERMAEAIEAVGRLASYSEVGSWVRHTGRARLARNAEAVEAMANAPVKGDRQQLSQPLSIFPTAREDMGAELGKKIDAFQGVSSDELRTDVTTITVSRPQEGAPQRPPRRGAVKIALLATGAVVVVALGLWLGMSLIGGSATTPSRAAGYATSTAASSTVASVTSVPSDTVMDAGAPSTTSTTASATAPDAEAPETAAADSAASAPPFDAGVQPEAPVLGSGRVPVPGGGKVPVGPKTSGTGKTKPYVPPDI